MTGAPGSAAARRAGAALPPSPIQEITDPGLGGPPFHLILKRDDLISPEFPGNKWRKLKLNIDAALHGGHRTLLTFGGAYSNHVRATAAAGARVGLAAIGVIRGEDHRPLNPSLSYAAGHGMRLIYLDRASYRGKTDPELLAGLRDRFGAFYLLPEGGSNALAARGCAELAGELSAQVAFDVVCVPCGTGGTLAGVAAGLAASQRAVGFSAPPGGAGFLPAARRAPRRLADRRRFSLRRLRPPHVRARRVHRHVPGPARPDPGPDLRGQDDVRDLRPRPPGHVRPRPHRGRRHHRIIAGPEGTGPANVGAVVYRHPLAFLLGLEGVALL